MAEKRNYNIVFMGMTGTGKSTIINAILNYLTYNSLDDALNGDVKHVIPQMFSYTDNQCKTYDIKIGDQRNIQNQNAGSTTKKAQVYSFQHNQYNINLIDTPGVADADGIDTDKKQIKETLEALSAFDEIHGICILIKSNESKLTPTYEYCLNEILLNLHKSAVNNVFFIFTNSRTDNYTPGNARGLIRTYLDKLRNKTNIEIPLNKDTIYCIDNETFRYQCIHAQNPALLQDITRANYQTSWNRSYETVRRLMNKLTTVDGYSSYQTLSINEARTIIMLLIPVLTTINTVILQNMTNIDTNFRKIIDDLVKHLSIDEYTVESEDINYPRTVCTSQKCLGIVVNEHGRQVHYKQICHDECYLKGVPLASFPEERLRDCSAMDAMTDGRTCLICGCKYEVHMHINFLQKTVLKKSKINDCLSGMKTKNQDEVTQKLKEIRQKLMNENEKIINYLVLFVNFLKQNAFFKYNDSFEAYMELAIRGEQSKVANGGDRTVLEKLEQQLNEFQLAITRIDNVQNNDQQVTVDDVAKAKDELFKLELYGEKIQELYNKSSTSNIKRLNDKSFIKQTIEKDILS